ncbi:MAG: transposase [Methylotenera sp.]
MSETNPNNTNNKTREIKRIIMEYRRYRLLGGTYFFTINLLNRKSSLLTDHADVLKQAFSYVKQKHPFEIPAIVVLPEHMHLIMELPEGDDGFPKRIMLIKQYFSRQIPKIESIKTSRLNKGERGIWQRRYWEHCIRDEQDYQHHVDYIHINPVKHGLVSRASDWQYSSIHQYIKRGIYPENWAADIKLFVGD